VHPLLIAEGFAPRYELLRLDGAGGPGLAVVKSAAASGRVAARPGAELLARIHVPETPYRRLLRTPLVMNVLRLTRPRERVDDLDAKAHPEPIEIYRLP
jgi:hypothetical protein